MPTLTEGKYAGEFICSEANGRRSREEVTVASGQNVKVAHILGKVTASGEYIEWNPANVDGSQTVAGISHSAVDATGGAKKAVIIARDAELNEKELEYFAAATAGNKDTAKAQLANLGIIVRKAV